MTVRVSPSITVEQETSSGNGYNIKQVEKTKIPLNSIADNYTTGFNSSSILYQLKLPSNVDVLDKAMKSLSSIRNASVRNQTSKLLMSIHTSLQEVIDVNKVSNRLSMLHLTEREDQSALLEWNYESFRIGFSLEPNNDDSNYYIVSENRNSGSFYAETNRLGNNYKETINAIANYVIRNT